MSAIRRNFSTLSLGCVLAAAISSSLAHAAPENDWDVYLSSPGGQAGALQMLPHGHSRTVADDGGLRLLALDGLGPNPNFLRSLSVNSKGDLKESPMLVANDYQMGAAADLDMKGDYYVATYGNVSGTFSKTWEAGSTQVETALAFALEESDSIAAVRVTAAGDTVLARRVAVSAKRSQFVVERYSKGGKLSWSHRLARIPAGAVSLSERANGDLAVAYVRNGAGFSAVRASVAEAVELSLSSDGQLWGERAHLLDSDYQATAVSIAPGGDVYFAIKNVNKQGSTCSLLAMSPAMRMANIAFSVQGTSCTAPSTVAADDLGFAALFEVSRDRGAQTLLAEGSPFGERWVREMNEIPGGLSGAQIARTSLGLVAVARPAAQLSVAAKGVINLQVDVYGAVGQLISSEQHPDLRTPEGYALTVPQGGGYIVSYSSFDRSIGQPAIAVSKRSSSLLE